PEGGRPADLGGEIGVARLLPFAAVPLRHYGEEHQLELLGGQGRRALPLHLAVGPEDGGLTHAQVQVRRRRVHQRLEQLAQRALGGPVLRRRKVGGKAGGRSGARRGGGRALGHRRGGARGGSG